MSQIAGISGGELVTQAALAFVKSRLSQKEIALLRVMAKGNRTATTAENRVTVGDETYQDADLVLALQGKLSEFGYVARNEDGGGYFLTSQGTAAAFAPILGKRTWVEIGLLTTVIAAVISIVAVLGWHFQGPQIEAPIGSIVAWHPNLFGLADDVLPDGWVRCDGQKEFALGDHRRIDLPDLNGDGKFLRGGIESGTPQADAFQGHKHKVTTDQRTELQGAGGGAAAHGPMPAPRDNSDSAAFKGQDPITDGRNGPPRTSDETRPVNMSVVWIIRVK